MQHLFIYGSLGPNRPNEHHLTVIKGQWRTGYVLGKLYQEGWGAKMGFPGIRLEEPIEKIHGFVYSSEDFEQLWATLDEFEGAAYQRVKTIVYLDDQQIEAYIYALT